VRTIYGICDEHGQVVYVGATKILATKRVSHHWQQRGKRTTPLSQWLATLTTPVSFIILEEDVPEDQYAIRETVWIEYYGLKNLFNTKLGGDNFRDQPYHLTPEQLERNRTAVRIASTGRSLSAEARQNISQKNMGRKRSDEAKAKMRAAKIGRTLTPEHKKKISESGKGRTFSPETRAKMSKALKGRSMSTEQKDLLSIRWSEVSRESTSCSYCDKGPFKGPRALKIHMGHAHKDLK
jgi:plasmid stability protein